jgi:hypothetical protein
MPDLMISLMTPQRCRDNAAECREIALKFQDDENTRSILQDLAEGWDQLAEELEKRGPG